MAREYDLVIVGMGSGGMIAAELAATLDLRVACVERGRLGGDCLWTGCVPSKALLASARAAHHMRTAGELGITPVEPEIDTAAVFDRIRRVQQRIASTDDSPERFEGLGVELVHGTARLTEAHSVDVDGRVLDARFVLLATGSRPALPPITGLAESPHLTSETVWGVERAPASLVVIGGGPIAIEMAQAFTRLGSPVTVLEREPRVLGRDEPELVDRLVRRLGHEGVDIRVGVEIERVEVVEDRTVVHLHRGGAPERVEADAVLVAAGRSPNVEGLGLDDVGVQFGPTGIHVDGGLRTSVKSIYAAGDVAGRWLFTHSAAFEGARAVRNMFFPSASRDDLGVPWCTFTEPELAHAGLTEAQARERFDDDDVRVWRHDLAHSDRARADGSDDGEIRVVTRKGRIVGAHVLSPAAGEIIQELALAIDQGLKLADLGSTIHVYPTLSTGLGQLGGEAAFAGAQRYRFLVRR